MKPPPQNPPPTSIFLAAVTDRNWSAGKFLDGNGVATKPNASSGSWALASTGLWTTEADAALLHGASMSADGLGFVTSNGHGYFLEWAGEYARAVAR